MNFKVFALLLTIFFAVECQSPSSEMMPKRVAEMVERPQEKANQVSEGNTDGDTEAMKSGLRSNLPSSTTQGPIIIEIDEVPVQQPLFVQQPQTTFVVSRPQPTPPPQQVIIQQKPQQPQQVVIQQRPQQPQQVIIAQPQPQIVSQPIQVPQVVLGQPIPQPIQVPQVVLGQPIPQPIPQPINGHRSCSFRGSEGTCTSIPSLFSCIRGGGILVLDVPRCSWVQACCIRNFFFK